MDVEQEMQALPAPYHVAEAWGRATDAPVRRSMRRDAAGLTTALRILAQLEVEQAEDEAFLNMCATATLITISALQRRESRGGHFRSDYPDADPACARRSHITLDAAHAIRDRVLSTS